MYGVWCLVWACLVCCCADDCQFDKAGQSSPSDGQNQDTDNTGNDGNAVGDVFQKILPGSKNAQTYARQCIQRTVSTEEAFHAIAYDTGFPVITDDKRIIFIHWYTGGQWYVSGGFNGWKKLPMVQSGDIWHAEVLLPDNLDDYGYKFINVESGIEVYQADPWALRQNYDENGELSYIADPQKAHLMRWNDFQSPQGLKSRAIRAYVPPHHGKYDVLYAQDGQNLFGTQTDANWQFQKNMAQIDGEFLIVGIDSSDDRMREYAHTDDNLDGARYESKGRTYARFVMESVKPFIESKFQTSGKNGILGSSLGGLISLYIALLYPEDFRAAFAFSPTTAWGQFGSENPTIQALYEAAGRQSVYLYVDSGGSPGMGCASPSAEQAWLDERERDCYCYTSSFVTALKNMGYVDGADLTYVYDPNATHDEQAWARRLAKALEIFNNL